MILEQYNIFGGVEKVGTRKPDLKQVKDPCPICGSYYRRGNLCNVCKTDLKEPEEKEVFKKKREFSQRGRFYSKTKKHRG
jgi:ribosomal protein L32